MPDPKIIICPGTRNVVDSSKKSGKQKLPETGETIPIYKDMSHAAKHRYDDSGGHSYEIFAWHSAGVFPSGLRFDKEERISLPRTKRPYMQFIIADSDQDPENNGAGGVVLGALVHNNWPDAATNNHGKDGGNIGFLDGHGEWVTHRNWVPVHLRSAHLAWPEALARETYFPGLRKEARTDGGEGYVWYLQ
jgi:prepilin-type processing-associated H-X9-DG protein